MLPVELRTTLKCDTHNCTDRVDQQDGAACRFHELAISAKYTIRIVSREYRLGASGVGELDDGEGPTRRLNGDHLDALRTPNEPDEVIDELEAREVVLVTAYAGVDADGEHLLVREEVQL
jgi:hypothetical protein